MLRVSFSGHFLRIASALAWLGLVTHCCRAQSTPASNATGGASQGSYLVFPFENAGGGPRLEWLGEGLEELTIQRLSVAGEQVYTHDARISELERYGVPSSAKVSRATMLRIAEELDADFVIFGSYTFDGNILAVQARLLRVSPAALLPPVRETGLLDTLMDLHTRVVWRLLSGNGRDFRVSLAEFSRAQKPLRLDAFEHYVRGLLAADGEARSRELREANRLEPNWPEPVFALGQLSFARRDCPTAITWFSRIPQAHERYMQAMFSTGVCRLWMNEPERAEAAFTGLQATLRGPAADAGDLPEILNNLAIARSRSGKLQLAQEDLRRAADLDPDASDYPFNLGLVALRTNDLEEAISEFRDALQREPDDSEVRALLIFALERAGKKSEAEAERAAASAAPRAGPLPVIRPENLGQLGRIISELDVTALPQEMEFALRHADGAPASPSSVPGPEHVRRGRQELSTGHLADAEHEFRAALAAEARDPSAHRGLAEVFRRQGKMDEAVKELLASLETRDSAVVRTMLAKIYLGQKKPDLARAEVERALKLAPNYAEAKQLLGHLQNAKPAEKKPGGAQ